MTKKRVTEIETNLNALENKLSTKETDLTELRKQIDDTNSRNRSLEKDLEEERRDRKNLANELSVKETDLTKLREQQNATKSWATSLENELGKDKSKLEWLQKQHARLSTEKTSVENKLGQMQTTYDELVEDLKRQIQNQEVTIKTYQEKISVSFIDRILFKTGKATITPEGKKVLRRVGKTLKNVQDKKIRVVGHTDDVPIIKRFKYKFPSNWELSAARAARVIRFFQNEIGIDPSNMEAVGRSFYDPISSNDTAEGRALNRRVNIIIAPTF